MSYGIPVIKCTKTPVTTGSCLICTVTCLKLKSEYQLYSILCTVYISLCSMIFYASARVCLYLWTVHVVPCVLYTFGCKHIY